MTQLIASNQLTLTNVNDGKTSYHHWAYSDNADGTGLTLTDNGQRYMGYYTDYTKADSTDKTKYKWANRWAKIEVGGQNLLKVQSKDWIEVVRPAGNYYFQKGSDYKVKVGQTYTFSIIVEKVTNDAVPITLSLGLGDKPGRFMWGFKNPKKYNIPFGEKISLTFTVKETDGMSGTHTYFAWRLRNEKLATTIRYKEVKLEKGTVATDFSRAEEDIQADINTKADQALTQEQLNALNERNQILESEMQAKASIEAFSEFEKAYQSFVKSNAEGQAKAEADLIEAGRRIELLTTQFGGLAELKTFIDTYMSSSNEGFIIGKNDASSTIKVSSDRISMFSAGKEVMYISQGVINIDNGIFTASVQIGRFRTEQYELNADMNVIRYVG